MIADDGFEEYKIKEILNEQQIRRGRGWRHEYLVKWTDYARLTWEPASAMKDTVALDVFEHRRVPRPPAAAAGGG
jgi:hypothetical protein